MRTTVLSAALILAPLAAQSVEQPIFRSGVDLVTVDATVLDGDGRPIEGLTAEDFELRVDGQPRPVASAHFVAVGRDTRPAEDTPRPSHYSTNEHAPRGRHILVVVDQEHIRAAEGMAALRAVGRFVEMLHPDDRIAVTGIPRLGSMLDFTTDRRAVKATLEELVGQVTPVPAYFNIGMSEALHISDGSRQHLDIVVRRECGTSLAQTENLARAAEENRERDPCPVQIEQEARAQSQYIRNQASMSLAALRALIDSVRSIEGPKTIILISEGLVAEPRYIDFSQLAAAAAAARVTIHVLQLETPVLPEASQQRPSPTILDDRFLREDGLTRLAGSARGGLFPFVGDGTLPFARIRRELSGYYLVGFEAAAADRDGRPHRIALRVKQRGALVRARQAFTADSQPKERAVADQLTELVRSPRLATELPLRVSTYTYQDPGTSKLRVVVSAELPKPTDAAAAGPTLAFVLLDTQNVIAASATHVASNGRHAFSTTVAPGDYTLKVAAIDPLGRRGSVERGFAARLQEAGQLRISDLLVAAAPPSPEEPLHPTVDGTDDRDLVAYLELYADETASLRQATVRIEVATSESGPSFVTVPATVHRRDARWAIARAQLPTEAIPAGRYFVRAQLFVAGQPIKRLVRPFAVEPARRAGEK